jgi:RNA polymerase sigma-70 factor (ECF subfamily)
VLAAGAEASTRRRAALESLCGSYWYPLYAFERRRGSGPEEARDLVQGFFAALLEKEWVRDADPGRGRFRTFLLAAFRHFCSHERERARAQKRGGGRTVLPLDFESGEGRFLREPADDRTPERLYERRWALALLDGALERLRDRHRREGRADLFEALQPYVGGAGSEGSYAAAGARLGMSEGAVKVAVHRLRRRFRETLREAIAETVADPSEVDDEIRRMQDALGG